MIVVVGAGLAGLRAALTIQESGQQVHVIEGADRVGGRVSSEVIAGFTIDRGFQVINPGYQEFVDLDITTAIHPISAGAVAQISGRPIFFGDPRREVRASIPSLPVISENFTAFLGLVRAIFLSKIDQGENARNLFERIGVSGPVLDSLVEPFLRGVFLTSLDNVDARFARRVLRSLFRQVPGLPDGGVHAVAHELRNRVKSLQCGERVREIERSGAGFVVKTENATISARKVIVATDWQSARAFHSQLPETLFARSTAWYFSLESPLTAQHQLRLAKADSGPVVTSIELSSIVPSYSPDGRGLLSVTTLESVSEEVVRAHLAQIYGEEIDGELITRFDIENALPVLTPGARRRGVLESSENKGLIFAGDYLTEPSQNGALLSGRLAGERAINN